MQNQQIAEKIKKICKDRNITIKKMLEDCSINRNFIYGLEKANKTPSSSNLKKISSYFNIPVGYFYDEENVLKEYKEHYMLSEQVYERIKKLCKDNKVTIKKMLEDCGINRNFMYDLKIRQYC